MPNLIDKLTARVDAIRQKAADKFGLPMFNMYRVIRTYTSGNLGDGSFTEQVDLILPTPMIKFTGQDQLEHGGRFDNRHMTATEISLTYTEDFLQGDPKVPGQECFYKLVERNSQAADTTYWILDRVPEQVRGDVYWQLEFKRYVICP